MIKNKGIPKKYSRIHTVYYDTFKEDLKHLLQLVLDGEQVTSKTWEHTLGSIAQKTNANAQLRFLKFNTKAAEKAFKKMELFRKLGTKPIYGENRRGSYTINTPGYTEEINNIRKTLLIEGLNEDFKPLSPKEVKKYIKPSLAVVTNFVKDYKEGTISIDDLIDRTKLIANSEVARITNATAIDLAKKVGLEFWMWGASDSKKPRVEHEVLYGKVSPIGKSPAEDGELPGELANCGCQMIFITDDDIAQITKDFIEEEKEEVAAEEADYGN